MKKELIVLVVAITLFLPAGLVIGHTVHIEEQQILETNLDSEELEITLYTQPNSFGINLDIENTGIETLHNISWNFCYKTSISEQGLLLNEKIQKGMIEQLDAGETQTVQFKPFNSEMSSPLGLANVYLNASVSTGEYLVRTQQRSFVFLFFLLNSIETYMDIYPADAYEMNQSGLFDVIIDVSPV